MIINYLCKIFSKLTCDLQSVSSEVMHNYLHFFYIFYVKSFIYVNCCHWAIPLLYTIHSYTTGFKIYPAHIITYWYVIFNCFLPKMENH